MTAILYLAAIAIVAAPAPKAERRCGWLDNPSPANLWLKDRDGEWLISQQGGYHAPGVDDLPDMTTKGTVSVNGSYGYSCACMVVTTNRARRLITRIISAQPRPLRQCRSDRRLPRP